MINLFNITVFLSIQGSYDAHKVPSLISIGNNEWVIHKEYKQL